MEQTPPRPSERLVVEVPKPVITISRMLGAGGEQIAQELAEHMDCQVIGVQIVDEIAKKAGVRHDLLREMDENIISNKDAWVTAAIVGTLFHESDYAQAIHQVVHSFSRLGSVVILGRGGGFAPSIGPRLDVRIIAPMAYRIEQLVRREGIGRKAASEAIKASDTQRRKFIKQMFGRDWSDPAEFDLVINTAKIDMAGAVSIIEHAWKRKTGVNADQSLS